MAHPYIAFRMRLARHGLAQFVESIRSLAVMAAILFSQMLLATVALIAFPPMYFASTANWALLFAYGALLALPCYLLRHRLLPADVVLWLRSRPIAPALRMRADVGVAGLLLAPLALANLVSACLILFYGAPWLHPAAAIAGAAASLLTAWAMSALILGVRQRGVERSLRVRSHGRPVAPLLPAASLLRQWRLLYWAPFWRMENSIGIQQCLFLAGALAAAVTWMWLDWTPAIAANIVTSVLLVIVTDRGDQAVRAQHALLAPVTAAWPRATVLLTLLARGFSALPALAVMVLLFAGGIAATRAGTVYLVLGVVAILLLVAPPTLSVRARPGIVLVSMVALMAAGSELP